MNALPGIARRWARLTIPLVLVAVGLSGWACSPAISVGEKAVIGASAQHKAIDIEKTPATLDECAACHSDDGRLVTSPVAPTVPHSTESWQECGFCHSPGRLAPVSDDHPLTANDTCLNCHRESSDQPPRMAHLAFPEKACSSCHQPGTAIPLDHSEREDYVCTLCHQPPSVPPPEIPHALVSEPACATCHAAGSTNALPIDHASRDQSMCGTCHLVRPDGVPRIEHPLINRTDCVFCHGAQFGPPPGIQ